MTFALAPSHYLAPLLAPRSIALIGASERANSLGRVVYENLLGGGFKGELFAVNPHYTTLLGRPAYASLAALGRKVDLGIVCSPPATISGILAEARGRLRALAILSRAPNGSDETRRRWRRELCASARAAGVRVLGPQTFGIMRTSLGLNATYGAVTALPGRLTLISQSGAIAAALLDFARVAGIGFASIISVGSGSDVDASELLDFALTDPQTEGILLYLETVGDARRFMSALRAAARTKPVIVLKGGRGYADATSHAPSADRVFDAALKRAGTVRVQNYTQLFAAARILASGRLPRGARLAILTNGRGPGLLAADRAIEAGVALAALSRETKAALAQLLPSGSRIENPVDLRGDASPDRFASALRAVLADDRVDAGLVLHVATPAAPPAEAARAVATLAKSAEKPLLAAWLGAVARGETDQALEAGGLANFYTPENAVEAFSFLVAYRRNQQWLLEAPPPQAETVPPDAGAAERIRARIGHGGVRALHPRQARALLTRSRSAFIAIASSVR
jgi:acetyltransferase